MDFNYEQSTWGEGTANLRWRNPAAFRLKMSLCALPKKGKVLEYGCGAGQFIRAVKKLRPELECFGYDISENAIKKAKTYNDDINYSSTFDFRLSTFDYVMIYDVLEHVENPNKLVKDVKEVLKPGGVFYLYVPCERDWTSLWNFLEKLHLKKDLTKKHAGHINYFTRKEVYDILKEYDFKLIDKKYSEHFIGQLVNIVSFFLMERFAKKNNLKQVNNEAYFSNIKASSLKKIVNSLVYLESLIFQYFPSPNLHVFSKKNKGFDS